MEIFLLVAGLLVVFVAIAAILRQLERRRRQSLEHVAVRLHMRFHPEGIPVAELPDFRLFRQGHTRRTRNLITGVYNRRPLCVFDYRYTVGGGQHASIRRHTVALLPLTQGELPRFELRPEHFLHKFGSALGYQDIDFEHHPEFSSRYLLRGEDERAVRRCFERRVLQFFEHHEPLCVEGSGSQLLVYRPRRRVAPEKIREFLDQVDGICALFT